MKLGLALGGGGARGYAHFGVLHALERCGIGIDCVAGTSIGAAVGALWATDQHIACHRELKKLTKPGIMDYMDPEIPVVSGILKGEKIYRVLQSWFKGYRIEHLMKEFCANAVDLDTGVEKTFTSGSLSDVIRASVSLPVIFAPWQIGRSRFLDGGVVNPLPIRQCLEMGADTVIAVDLLGVVKKPVDLAERGELSTHEDHFNLAQDFQYLKKLFTPVIPDIALKSIFISQKALIDSNLGRWKPTFLIRPDLSGYTGSEFHLVEEISAKGLAAAEKVLPDILDKLAR